MNSFVIYIFIIIGFVFVRSTTIPISDETFQQLFNQFMEDYNKIYSSNSELLMRLSLFKVTYQFIETYNDANSLIPDSMTMGLNEFADWTFDERKSLCGTIIDETSTTTTTSATTTTTGNGGIIASVLSGNSAGIIANVIGGGIISNLLGGRSNNIAAIHEKQGGDGDLPVRNANLRDIKEVNQVQARYIDWRGSAVTSVKNQQHCGSCYAFAAVAVIESALKNSNRGEFDLSEQDVVDCTFSKYSYGLNFGCEGGDPSTSIQHALRNSIADEHNYFYTSGNTNKHSSCKPAGGISLKIFNMYQVSKSEDLLAHAVSNGPIAITLNGENNEFYNYKGGIYNNPACSTTINHAVLLVGYGIQNGQEYWIIKNSWGSTWGMNGFMYLAKGFNRCGIVSQNSYFVQ